MADDGISLDILPRAVPFSEAIDYLRGKVDVPSRAWTDLKEKAHARAFTVAGATTMDLVSDFHAAVTRAIEDGTTREEFRKDFDRIVAAHGWSYNGGRGWRSAVIYNTNLRMAQSAGRWAQARRLADAENARGRTVYIRYSAVLDSRTRPQHRAWHDIILPIDHPFWRSHTPPNGWNCRCTIQILTERGLRRRGLVPTADADIPSTTPEPRQVNTPYGTENWPTPTGIDTGFGYNPGDAWLRGGTPMPLDEPLPRFGPAIVGDAPPPPAPRPFPESRMLPADLDEAEYVDRFLNEFGGARDHAVGFRDAGGHLIGISDDLFIDRRQSLPGAPVYKATKFGRARYLLALADALKAPDEIWLDWAEVNGAPSLRRRYIRHLELPGRAGLVAAFEWTTQGWAGRTIFAADTTSYIEGQRQGQLLYRREE
ncbi:minor capsid protein [Marivibrio halodurans]|uniref:Minor capsid protein n=1 Tax=Marivibrio halodurans TaxID=2039722 RepID=A0A8J7V442_9PROT|nr:PBECR2 nuclease fold domain-containing protein [Marivibrio halodurans]MBP5857284.1 minor capsid protein [Marivibrio halodurans]